MSLHKPLIGRYKIIEAAGGNGLMEKTRAKRIRSTARFWKAKGSPMLRRPVALYLSQH